VALTWPAPCFRGWRAVVVWGALTFALEMAQHVREMALGMFASHEVFVAHRMDPWRLILGVPKQLALWIGLCCAARLVAGFGQRPLWRRMGLALLAFALGALAGLPVLSHLSPTGLVVFETVQLAVMAPFLSWLVTAIMGDRAMTLRLLWGRGWVVTLCTLLPFGVIQALVQWVHRQDHVIATGAPMGHVAALMAWDALWVAVTMIAAGAALGQGYRIGRRWSGITLS
jgi:hypothetical protein